MGSVYILLGGFYSCWKGKKNKFDINGFDGGGGRGKSINLQTHIPFDPLSLFFGCIFETVH
jgi:hypothetical protein